MYVQSNRSLDCADSRRWFIRSCVVRVNCAAASVNRGIDKGASMFSRDYNSELVERLTQVNVKIRILTSRITKRERELQRSYTKIARAVSTSSKHVESETLKAALCEEHIKKLKSVLETAQALASSIEVARYQFSLSKDVKDINKTMTRLAAQQPFEQMQREIQALQDNMDKAYDSMNSMNKVLTSKAVDPETLERIRNDAVQLSRTTTINEHPVLRELADDLARRLENA